MGELKIDSDTFRHEYLLNIEMSRVVSAGALTQPTKVHALLAFLQVVLYCCIGFRVSV